MIHTIETRQSVGISHHRMIGWLKIKNHYSYIVFKRETGIHVICEYRMCNVHAKDAGRFKSLKDIDYYRFPHSQFVNNQ